MGLDLGSIKHNAVTSGNNKSSDQLFDTFKERMSVTEKIAAAASSEEVTVTVNSGKTQVNGRWLNYASIDFNRYTPEQKAIIKANLEKNGYSYDSLMEIANQDGDGRLSSFDLAKRYGTFLSADKNKKGFTQEQLENDFALKGPSSPPAEQTAPTRPKRIKNHSDQTGEQTPKVNSSGTQQASAVAQTISASDFGGKAQTSVQEFLGVLVKRDIFSKETATKLWNQMQTDAEDDIPISAETVEKLAHFMKMDAAVLKDGAEIENSKEFDVGGVIVNLFDSRLGEDFNPDGPIPVAKLLGAAKP